MTGGWVEGRRAGAENFAGREAKRGAGREVELSRAGERRSPDGAPGLEKPGFEKASFEKAGLLKDCREKLRAWGAELSDALAAGNLGAALAGRSAVGGWMAMLAGGTAG